MDFITNPAPQQASLDSGPCLKNPTRWASLYQDHVGGGKFMVLGPTPRSSCQLGLGSPHHFRLLDTPDRATPNFPF